MEFQYIVPLPQQLTPFHLMQEPMVLAILKVLLRHRLVQV